MNQQLTGKFIAQLRKEKNLTQKELADKLGISDKTVSKWETGVSHS
ncbi:MAG: helix-turn-helix transcriptional regulator [Butyrivibrio sp.]|nr:helix-turn-helix transcriptional regulator [Butyrivibrio sp.]MBO6196142.1 helix-turn-helix transcriptional regulator [Butyrivibrio sp.]